MFWRLPVVCEPHVENSCLLGVTAVFFYLLKPNWYIFSFLGQCKILRAFTLLPSIPLVLYMCICFKHKILLKLSSTCLTFSLLIIFVFLTFLLRSFFSACRSALFTCLKMSLFHLIKYVLRFCCCCFANGLPVFPSPFVEETILFLLNYLCILSKTTNCIDLSLEFSILFHWSVYFPQYHSLDYYSLLYCLEIG